MCIGSAQCRAEVARVTHDAVTAGTPEPVQYSAANRSIGSTTGCTITEKALVGAFSVIVQPVVEPIEYYTALIDINVKIY